MQQADFERLYAEHAQRLFGFLVYRTGDRALAEDVLADTFELAYRARKRFDRGKASERTWLYAIALNRLRDVVRRSTSEARALARVSSDAEGASLEAGFESVESRDELVRAMAHLSEEEREALALRFGADLALKEIAAALGQSMSTVEARVYRGLRKLRDQLGDEAQ